METTKEQNRTAFKAINEEKLAWSEKDEAQLWFILNILERESERNIGKFYNDAYSEAYDWLKSFKERITH